MTQAAFLPMDETLGADSPGVEATVSLASLARGDSGCVVKIDLEPEMSAWLRAVGVSEGERVTVLRRAAFGGPIHVRTGAGGEFALHRALALSVLTRRIHDAETPG